MDKPETIEKIVEKDTEKVQDAFWNILQNISEWIHFSDQKGVFVITTYSIILTLIYSNAKEIGEAVGSSTVLIISAILISATSIVSIYLSFKCLSPTLSNIHTSSIFFFGHIANHKGHDQYYNHAKSIINNDRAIEENLAEQIYTNSKIATNKFKLVSWSIQLQVLSILLMLISLTIYFLS